MQTRGEKLQTIGVLAVLLPLWILPFQSQGLRFFERRGWDSSAYSLILPIFEFIVFTLLVSSQKIRKHWLHIIALSFLTFAGLSILWSGKLPNEHLRGLYYGIMPLVAYTVARVSAISLERINPVLQKVSTVVLILCGAQLVIWQYENIPLWDFFNWFPIFRIIGETFQVFGTFPGPNQLASFVLVSGLFFLTSKASPARWPLTSASFITLFLTRSDSALLGLIGGLLIYACWAARAHIRKILFATSCLAVVIISIGLSNRERIKQEVISFRAADHSVDGHLSGIEKTLAYFSEAPLTTKLFGHGAATAGPATLSSVAFLPESWILQILHEYGVLGLATYLAILWSPPLLLLKKRGNPQGLVIITAVTLNALFLHILADNSALIYLLGLLEASWLHAAMQD
jgi:hypothetical protein